MDIITVDSFNTMNTEETTCEYGMKWHKFLIYFSLWLSGFLNIVIGGMCLLDGMPLYGLVVLCAGAYQICVRFMLAGFKRNAYKHLLAANMIVVIANLLIGGEAFSSVLTNIAVGAVTFMYYKKRDKLFVF